jgi:hypothetical protein
MVKVGGKNRRQEQKNSWRKEEKVGQKRAKLVDIWMAEEGDR